MSNELMVIFFTFQQTIALVIHADHETKRADSRSRLNFTLLISDKNQLFVTFLYIIYNAYIILSILLSIDKYIATDIN